MAFLGNLTSRLEKDLKTAFGATVAHGSMAVPSAGTIPFPSQETDLKLVSQSAASEPHTIKVVNLSQEPVVVWVTDFNKPPSRAVDSSVPVNTWITIRPNSIYAWERPGKAGEYVMMRPVVTETGEGVFCEPNTTTVGVFVVPGVVVHVSGLAHPGVVVTK